MTRRMRFFPNETVFWYLMRGTLIGVGFGGGLAGLLILFVSAMGDGAGVNLWAEVIAPMMPLVAGWGILGFLGGSIAWSISRGVEKRRLGRTERNAKKGA